MILEFHDHYVIAILALMWALCCCRSLVQSFSDFIGLVDRCIEDDICCMKKCLGCVEVHHCSEIVRKTVILFCFVQPLLFLMIFGYHRSEGYDSSSILIFHNLELNTTGSYYNYTQQQILDHMSVESFNLLEIDYLILVMPFSILICASSLTWVHSIDVNDIHVATTWDTDLPESIRIYEIVYFFEVLTMNFAFIGTVSSHRSILEVYFASMTITFIMLYSLTSSKYTMEEDLSSHCITSIISIFYFCIAVPVWVHMVDTDCIVAVILAVIHTLIVFTLVTFHTLARGVVPVGHILLIRLMCTVFGSITHLIVYALGMHKFCNNTI